MIVLYDDQLFVPSGKRNAPNWNEPYKYTVHRETAVLYTLIKLKGGHTHAWMSDRIFGGADTRNQHIYRYVLSYLTAKYQALLGIEGLKNWVNFEGLKNRVISYPRFVEDIRKVVG